MDSSGVPSSSKDSRREFSEGCSRCCSPGSHRLRSNATSTSARCSSTTGSCCSVSRGELSSGCSAAHSPWGGISGAYELEAEGQGREVGNGNREACCEQISRFL